MHRPPPVIGNPGEADQLDPRPSQSVPSIRLSPQLHRAVVAWIESCPEPRPSYQRCVRHLVESGL